MLIEEMYDSQYAVERISELFYRTIHVNIDLIHMMMHNLFIGIICHPCLLIFSWNSIFKSVLQYLYSFIYFLYTSFIKTISLAEWLVCLTTNHQAEGSGIYTILKKCIASGRNVMIVVLSRPSAIYQSVAEV